MSTLGHHRIRERLSADQACKRHVFVVVAIVRGSLARRWIHRKFVELPSSEIVASVVQEFTRVAIATETGFWAKCQCGLSR